MSTKINKTFQRAVLDGRVGKQEVEQLIRDAMDGKGITKAEGETLKKLRAEHESKFTTAGKDAFDRFLSKMTRSWSSTQNVHLPHFDEGQLRELMASDPRIGIYAPRSGGKGGSVGSTGGGSVGKGGGSSTPVDTSPVDTSPVSGKGGSSAPVDASPAPVSSGGGKGGSSAPVDTSPAPVSSGGGKGGSVAPAPTPVAPPVSGSGK